MTTSVLMSTYIKECPEFLQCALKSIWTDQTRQPDEIILIEDGKLNQGLYDVIKEWKQKLGDRMVIVTNEQNLGLAISLNNGLRHAKGDIIIRMDSDDIAFPERISVEASYLEQHPEVQIVGSWVEEFIGNKSNVVSTRKVPEFQEEIYQWGKFRNPMNHPSVAFLRETILRNGGYTHFLLFEDYHLWVTLLKQGCTFYNIQYPLLWFRTSQDMFARRGGLRYAVTETKFIYYMYSIGYISIFQLLRNIPIRFISRILPNTIRSYIYKKTIR